MEIALKRLAETENYQTWRELQLHALARQRVSIMRGRPLAALYWIKIAKWANYETEDSEAALRKKLNRFQFLLQDGQYSLVSKAEWHMYCVHIRKMLLARGCDIPMLSLDWMKAEIR